VASVHHLLNQEFPLRELTPMVGANSKSLEIGELTMVSEKGILFQKPLKILPQI
jgi:hypothetical protein